MDTCKWYQDDYWETGCGGTFDFCDGGPKENHFKFCPYCGKPIEEVEQE